jgi:CHAT domain-containing protein
MARKRHLFYASYKTVLKYLLLMFCLMFIVVFGQSDIKRVDLFSPPAMSQTVDRLLDEREQARHLIAKGQAAYDKGQLVQALSAWEDAQTLYRKLSYPDGITGSLVNQTLVFKDLGQYPRACNTLLQALELEIELCDSPPIERSLESLKPQLERELRRQPDAAVRVMGLQVLGDVLRLLVKPEMSELVLQQAMAMAQRLSLPVAIDEIQLSLGNTAIALYRQARNLYELTIDPQLEINALRQARNQLKLALAYQRKAASSEESHHSAATSARLNQLSLALEIEQWANFQELDKKPNLTDLVQQERTQLPAIVTQLRVAQFSDLSPIQSVYSRLNFVESLIEINDHTVLKSLLFPAVEEPLTLAQELTQEAAEVAHRLANNRAESLSLGTLGTLYAHLGESSLQKAYLQKALSLAQSIQAWDVAYQWQWELGRLYRLETKYSQAQAAYQAALESLNQIQGNVLTLNSDASTFQRKVVPVYREYLRLLLSVQQPNLREVIKTHEKLQVAELEDYLRCGLLNLQPLSEIYKTTSLPPVIYLIDLGDQVEVIVQTPDQKLYRPPIDKTPKAEIVHANLRNLQLNFQTVQDSTTTSAEVLLPYAQALYAQLIAPIKPYLPDEGTLLFVADSSFQNLPLAMLHDGKQYLIETHSIAVTLGSRLPPSQPMQANQFKALLAGVSKTSPSFSKPNAPQNLDSLPLVATELKTIRANLKSSLELLDEAFTVDRFREALTQGNFPILHLSTHGQFSSDPWQTVILAWDQPIRGN